MAAVILALVLGVLLNMSTFGGQAYPVGSVAAIVIIGVWIKSAMDKHFADLKEQIRSGGTQAEHKED